MIRKNAETAAPEVIAALREIVAEPYAAARDWKKSGGRVVAYLCDNVPVELITAAQFLPCRLGGAHRPGREAYERLIKSQQSRMTRFGLTVAILESLASGECDFADYLVIPHNRKSVEAIHGQLSRMRASDPDVTAPQSWILDRSWLPGEASRQFSGSRIEEFRSRLEQWRGSAIADAELREACAAHAENRRLLEDVMALRFTAPPRLAGSTALMILRAGQVLPVDRHNALLREILAAAGGFAELTGPRIFLAGSPFDHDQLYGMVEAAGGVVVGEDHCWGMRCIEHGLEEGADPMRAIAERYYRIPGCSIAYPLQRNVDACLRRARACGADAVIFAVMADDQTHEWTTPDELEAVRAAGLPALHLAQLAYAIGDNTAAEIRHFVGGLS